MTTGSSSSESRSGRVSDLKITSVGSILGVEKGPGTICEGSWLGLPVGDAVSLSVAFDEALVSIMSE